MPDKFLIVAVAVMATVVLLWIFGPRAVARAITALPLVALALFCVWGFDASGDMPGRSLQLAWKAAYLMLGVTCLTGTVWLLWPRRARPK